MCIHLCDSLEDSQEHSLKRLTTRPTKVCVASSHIKVDPVSDCGPGNKQRVTRVKALLGHVSTIIMVRLTMLNPIRTYGTYLNLRITPIREHHHM